MKIYCCVCGLQITEIKQEWTTAGPATIMGHNEYACGECAKDLDENGLFPGEMGYNPQIHTTSTKGRCCV